jgi:predicted nuclease of predicted toxin-antitoxin system
MARTIRFHLDENRSKAIAVGLRRYGIKVTTTPEARLLGAQDEEHAAFAFSANRIIFTQDRDFLRINADFREESNLPIPHPISSAKRPIGPDFFGL